MDARVRYTKMVIHQEMFRLLEKQPLEKITVKQICDGAGINRATFYKYYENPYNLYEKLENELLEQLSDALNSNNAIEFLDVFRVVLQEIRDKYPSYRIFFTNHGHERFTQTVFDMCYGENMRTVRHYFKDAGDCRQEWVYYFIAEGCNGIFKKWLENGRKESVEEIVEFVRILVNGINHQGSKIK